MPTALNWLAEKYRATGNMAAEGYRRTLGKPEQDPLTTLIRETVQNSWDARRGAATPVYSLRAWALTDGQKKLLKKTVFAKSPADLKLARLWADKEVLALCISDRNTKGLNGPVRADDASQKDGERNYVNFLLNAGQADHRTFSGGTYGYGKSILYSCSQVRTVLVHSRTRFKGQLVTRFVGAALGKQYDGHTGRHWWGRKGAGGAVLPTAGKDAESISDQLGIPAFGESETGTNLVLLMPNLGQSTLPDREDDQRSGPEAMAFMIATLLWNVWPKMVSASNVGPRMKFRAFWNGKSIPIPNPEVHQAFSGFVSTLRLIYKARSDAEFRPSEPNQLVRDILCERPATHLGLIALERHPDPLPQGLAPPASATIERLLDYFIWKLAPGDGRVRHVALMRGPQIVVKYEGGPAPERGQYSGVFFADASEEVDSAFASAEPPAHDDWIPSGLPRPASTFVNVARRRIRAALEAFGPPSIPERAEGASVPLGVVSDRLAGLIPALEGTGSSTRPPEPEGRPPGKGAQRQSHRKPAIEITGPGKLEESDGQVLFRVPFRVKHPAEGGTLVRARPTVSVIDGNTEESYRPALAAVPEVHSWLSESGQSLGSGGEVRISAELTADLCVRVTVPRNASVAVTLSVGD